MRRFVEAKELYNKRKEKRGLRRVMKALNKLYILQRSICIPRSLEGDS